MLYGRYQMRLDVNCVKMLIVTAILVLAGSQTVQAEQVGALTLEVGSPVESQATLLTDVVDVQMYNRSIHIMVMLLVGFGFLNGLCEKVRPFSRHRDIPARKYRYPALYAHKKFGYFWRTRPG